MTSRRRRDRPTSPEREKRPMASADVRSIIGIFNNLSIQLKGIGGGGAAAGFACWP